MGIENPVHLLFIAVIALIVLGPRRLPELTRAVGKGIREFREAIEQRDSDDGVAVASEGAGEERPAHDEPTVGLEPLAVTEQAGDAAQVDPPQAVRSGDAPDRGPL
jgi:TatA/E family protein of Tat protein translocase